MLIHSQGGWHERYHTAVLQEASTLAAASCHDGVHATTRRQPSVRSRPTTDLRCTPFTLGPALAQQSTVNSQHNINHALDIHQALDRSPIRQTMWWLTNTAEKLCRQQSNTPGCTTPNLCCHIFQNHPDQHHVHHHPPNTSATAGAAFVADALWQGHSRSRSVTPLCNWAGKDSRTWQQLHVG